SPPNWELNKSTADPPRPVRFFFETFPGGWKSDEACGDGGRLLSTRLGSGRVRLARPANNHQAAGNGRTIMRIAYLTTDEVNQQLASRLAAGQEAQLEVIRPRDEPPDGRLDAVIYDLDCLPPPLRQQLLTDLAGGGARCPAAVHSYALEDEQIKALLRRGGGVRPPLRAPPFPPLSSAGPAEWDY